MISAAATHPGCVRTNNEDYVKIDDAQGIYLLADGIGGHNAGEVASALAVETVYSILKANLPHTEVDDYAELMIHALHTAHWEILSRSQADPALSRMGTTLVFAVVRQQYAYIVNTGDSRCYLFQPDFYPHPDPLLEQKYHKLSRLTQDHTVGDQLLEQGVPSSEIPRKQFHTLTRSLGCGNPPDPDARVQEIKPGDLLLFCSDGLSDMLSDEALELLLGEYQGEVQGLADRLIAAANARGGRDNVSVVIVAC